MGRKKVHGRFCESGSTIAPSATFCSFSKSHILLSTSGSEHECFDTIPRERIPFVGFSIYLRIAFYFMISSDVCLLPLYHLHVMAKEIRKERTKGRK